MVSFVCAFSLLGLVHFVVSSSVQRCPDGQYLDHSEGRCMPCHVICASSDEHAQQGCVALCPDVHSKLKTKTGSKVKELCPPGTFEDKATVRCEPCSTLCENSNSTDMQVKCHKFCPDYKKKEASSSKRFLLPILWTVAACLLVCLIAMVAFIICKYISLCRTKRIKFPDIPEKMHKKTFYAKLREENPKQRINQWLTLLHVDDTDGCHSNRSSLFVMPDLGDTNELPPREEEKC